MSRIGKQLITIPQGIEVSIANGTVKVKGPKGTLEYKFLPMIQVAVQDGKVMVTRKGNDNQARSAHGLARALINNMILGVMKGFEKRLEIVGVGYRAQATGKKITLNLGYSHPIEYPAPAGISIEMDKTEKNIIIITGVDKQLVGETAANIRKFRMPEPYKGKGIRYVNEQVKRKAGKTAVKTATAA
jgi:large subunit ribosomal protein L6